MRKLGAALLALPVLVVVYVASLDPRGKVTRLLAVAAAAAFLASAIVGMRPAPSAAVRASDPAPVSADLFMTIGTAHPLTAPFTVAFDTPMDPAAVAGALTIEPRGAYALAWDTAGRVLTISPVGHWEPGTLYSVVIGRTARSEQGGTLASPLRSVVLTATGGSGKLAATDRAGKRVRLDTAFSIRLDRALPLAAVQAGLRTEPAVAGQIVQGDDPATYTFTPYAPLAPGTQYRVWLASLVDADGIAFEAPPVVNVRTVEAPEVVRFRPRDDTKKVSRSAAISVRFSEAMDKARTTDAFSVRASGKPVKGKVTWAEGGTVIVFVPAAKLPYGTSVASTVSLAARSKDGAPIAKAATGTFKVEPKPKPKPKPKAPTESIPTGGGGGASGSWLAVERYYLKLMNCTRTGGWVTSGGKCSSPGGRNVAPLALSAGISSKVSRPYARRLARGNDCSHFIGGNPGDRLRRAGYTNYRWAENLGCRSGNPYSAVLGSHRFFQAEKPWNGGHYRNLMNAAYDRVGIGVWVTSGRVRLVIDFYHP